jgi:RNA polymerase sigma-70 factor (ECF subfamily)
MLLHDSRRDARVDAHGDLVALDEQDRARWDRGRIREGERLLVEALRRRVVGPYQLQAAIAALHATSPAPDATDFARIAALYGALGRLTPSPVIELNRAVALGRAEGSDAGLRALAPLLEAGTLDAYAPLHAAHADLLDRSGDTPGASAAYARAAALSDNAVARAELERRAARLAAG